MNNAFDPNTTSPEALLGNVSTLAGGNISGESAGDTTQGDAYEKRSLSTLGSYTMMWAVVFSVTEESE